MIVYRGENWKKWEQIKMSKCLTPKGINFELHFCHESTISYDGSATYGDSEQNAIIGHQLNSSKFPVAGVSTTPHIDRAAFYAFNDGKYSKGVILELDLSKVSRDEFKFHKVSDSLNIPNVPEDDEIIFRKLNPDFNIPLNLFKIYEVNGHLNNYKCYEISY